MLERVLGGDAGRKLVTQSRDLPCLPAGTAIRTFVRTEYTPTSFPSQAALFADSLYSPPPYWLMEGLPVARTQSPGCPGDVNRRQFPFMPTKPRAVFNPMYNWGRVQRSRRGS